MWTIVWRRNGQKHNTFFGRDAFIWWVISGCSHPRHYSETLNKFLHNPTCTPSSHPRPSTGARVEINPASPPVSRCGSGCRCRRLHNNLAPNSLMVATVLFMVLRVHINRAARRLWVWPLSPLFLPPPPLTFSLGGTEGNDLLISVGRTRRTSSRADTQHPGDGALGGVCFLLFFPLTSQQEWFAAVAACSSVSRNLSRLRQKYF